MLRLLLQLRAPCASRIVSQRLFTSEPNKPLLPKSGYKIDAKSFINSFKKELGAMQAKKKRELLMQKVEEQKAMRKAIELNELKNEKIAALRSERVAKENEVKLAKRLEGDKRRASMKRAVLKEQMERVENAVKCSSTFITSENLDERIEEILNTPKNVDFCLNKSGKKIM